HRMQIAGLFHDQFGEIAMSTFDAALGEIAGFAEVLVASAAGATPGMRAGTAHRRYYQITRREMSNGRSSFDNFSQRFVARHEILRSGWRRSIRKRADLSIGTTNPNVQDTQFDLIWSRDLRLFLFNKLDLPALRKNGYGFHRFLLSSLQRSGARLPAH